MCTREEWDDAGEIILLKNGSGKWKKRDLTCVMRIHNTLKMKTLEKSSITSVIDAMEKGIVTKVRDTVILKSFREVEDIISKAVSAEMKPP